VTVAGVTTSEAGLLDSDNRRITIQDTTAAILVRLPADAAAPAVGTRMRVTGKVGAYYGAPQLDVDSQPVLLAHDKATPLILRRAPAAPDEWMLIRVTVRIVNVTKNGDSWRAEVSLGAGGSMPVAGLAGSGIPSTALVEGRSAMLTGIVKRAYPTASDQRFALVPRSTADIELGAVPGPSPSAAPTGAGGSRSPVARSLSIGSDQPLPGGSAPASGSAVADDGGTVSTTIDGLTGLIGQRVRVGGRVASVDGTIALLSDGTGETNVRFMSEADAASVSLAADELVNVIGWDSERDVGGTEVVVTAATDVTRAPALGTGGDAGPTDGASPGVDPSPDATDGNVVDAGVADATEGPAGVGAAAAGLAAALAAAVLMLLAGTATYLRRRKAPVVATNPAIGRNPAAGANPAIETPAGTAVAAPANPAETDSAGTEQP
jgi:hypothetical protein